MPGTQPFQKWWWELFTRYKHQNEHPEQVQLLVFGSAIVCICISSLILRASVSCVIIAHSEQDWSQFFLRGKSKGNVASLLTEQKRQRELNITLLKIQMMQQKCVCGQVYTSLV